MTAPDKIYLNKYMIRPGMLRPAEFPADEPEFEYIRKDALVEYIKETIERNKPWKESLNDRYFGGIEIALENILEHLNTM